MMTDETWARVKTAAALAGKPAGTWARELIERELLRELGKAAATPVTDAYLKELRAAADKAKRDATAAQVDGLGEDEIDAARQNALAAARRLALAERTLRK